ncbi:MAG TPA: family 16 glycoside hydrolase [Vicinamibacterales bacterium]|nr:family 16 glycoside hydrolase [Vicinamibacterales bacterium]
MSRQHFARFVAMLVACAVSLSVAARQDAALVPFGGAANHDWPVYRGDPKGNQYSPLAQIHAANVHRLERAWEYRTGDANERSTMHANPIVVDGVIYVTTPSLKAVALNAATGKEIWVFDPARYNNGNVVRLRNRGVTYWKGTAGTRIFHFVRDRVYAVDAKTGTLITAFGTGGFIDLRQNLGIDPASAVIEMTSPGAVFKNILIIASRVNESYDASPGHIRGYDTVTGALKWIFHTIPKEGQVGHDTWKWVKGENYGGANAWGGVTIDEQRGWVFAATGSATEDFYGGFRKGDNLFANCVLALDAMTGERKWHFQTVRHDIWDYDNPPAPILVTIGSGPTAKDAVVQLTKMGFTFVLDRDTGTPLFPVQEAAVPRSTVPGEETSPTQLIPLKPQPLVRQNLTEADLTNVTPEARAQALKDFRRYLSGPIFTPPSLQGTITTPGHLGGAEWHGASFDPMLNMLYVNVNEAPTINRLRPVYDGPGAASDPVALGHQIYDRTCATCHGVARQGTPPHTPALVDLKRTAREIETVIAEGRNAMPAFRHFRARELSALAAFLKTPPTAGGGDPPAARPDLGTGRYTIDGYPLFLDPHGVPAIAPPWGTLNAIDLVKGEIAWKVPLGEYPQLAAKGIRHTGTLNFGGAIATAGGVIFVAATADEKIRAFEKSSGRVLWEHQLPAGGYATPSIYMIDGRQFIAIAAGGSGKNATRSGDSIIAFALPQDLRQTAPAPPSSQASSADGWINLFDGNSLDGWVHMNGAHRFSVEDGAIVGRTVESSASMNSFLCTLQEFDDFELELETWIDPVTNSGIQIRSQVRPVQMQGRSFEVAAGRVNGPQVEIRRSYKALPATGHIYGEAMGTNWLTSPQKIQDGHPYFVNDGWNKLRIVASGPRIRTWVNGQPVEDIVNEAVYKTHPRGFIGLQIHGLSQREVDANPGAGITASQPLTIKWRNIRIRPLK